VCNCDRDRVAHRLSARAACAWDALGGLRELYLNPAFVKPPTGGVVPVDVGMLRPACAPAHLRVFTALFAPTNPGRATTATLLLQ
jgi:hypothetical protein